MQMGQSGSHTRPRISVSYSKPSTTSAIAADPASPRPQASGSAEVNTADSPSSPSLVSSSQDSVVQSEAAAEEDEEASGKRKAKGRLGGVWTRARTGGATGRPKLTAVFIEQEGLRMDQEKANGHRTDGIRKGDAEGAAQKHYADL